MDEAAKSVVFLVFVVQYCSPEGNGLKENMNGFTAGLSSCQPFEFCIEVDWSRLLCVGVLYV